MPVKFIFILLIVAFALHFSGILPANTQIMAAAIVAEIEDNEVIPEQ